MPMTTLKYFDMDKLERLQTECSRSSWLHTTVFVV